jgi:hypothetical protein
MSKNTEITSEVGMLGVIFAAILSWTKWHNFWWMLLHSVLGWIYVIYYFIKGY